MSYLPHGFHFLTEDYNIRINETHMRLLCTRQSYEAQTMAKTGQRGLYNPCNRFPLNEKCSTHWLDVLHYCGQHQFDGFRFGENLYKFKFYVPTPQPFRRTYCFEPHPKHPGYYFLKEDLDGIYFSAQVTDINDPNMNYIFFFKLIEAEIKYLHECQKQNSEYHIPEEFKLLPVSNNPFNDNCIELLCTRRPYVACGMASRGPNGTVVPIRRDFRSNEPWSTHWLDVLFKNGRDRTNFWDKLHEFRFYIPMPPRGQRNTYIPHHKYRGYYYFTREKEGIYFEVEVTEINDTTKHHKLFFKLTESEVEHLRVSHAFNEAAYRRKHLFDQMLKSMHLW